MIPGWDLIRINNDLRYQKELKEKTNIINEPLPE